MGHINCMEAMTLIAMTFIRREKCKVYTFTANRQLQAINFKTTDSYEKSYIKCVAASVSILFLTFL